MAAAQLVVLGLVLLGVERGFGAGNISISMLDVGSKTRLTCTLDSSDTAILGHRWMKGDKVLQEDSEADLTTQFEVDTLESPGQYSCTFLSKPTDRTASVNVKGPPKIKAVKKSEHATEGETVVLACKSESFPPVTQWVWYKIKGDEIEVRAAPASGGAKAWASALQGLPVPRFSTTCPRTSWWCPRRPRRSCTSRI